MADENGRPSFDEFDARLRRLREHDATRQPPGPDEQRHQPRLNWGSGLQVGIELLAGVLGGVLIGYGLDRWLDTRPLFIIVFFLLGAVAGMLNAYRHLRRISEGRSP